MYKITALLIFCLLFLNCTFSEEKTEKKTSKTITINKFVITGNFNRFFTSKVYLNKIANRNLLPIDSAEVINNSFIFEGKVLIPERYALTFKDYSPVYIFIIENKNIILDFDILNILNPKISNSPLNNQLTNYRKEAKKIFKQLDNLYVLFQKARLENDAKKIEEIGRKVKIVENQFHDFTFSYIEKNKNSIVSSMLLRDQLKASIIDSVRVLNGYKKLSTKAKSSPDAKIVARYLQLK